MRQNEVQTAMFKNMLVFILLLIFLSNLHASTLIGYWGFEEGSGSTAFNSSSNAGLDGNIYNGTYTTGVVGNYALSFNGSNTYVEIANSSLLVPQTIGISLWFNPGSSQVYAADILDKGHGHGSNPYYGGYVLQYGDTSSTNFAALYGNGSTFCGVSSGNGYQDNTWHHLVANLGQDEISIYLDGVLISKIAGQGALVQNDANLYFGRHRFLGRYFNGLLDEIRLYDGALSQEEVNILYAKGDPSLIPELSSWLMLVLGALSVLFRKTWRS